MKPKRILAMAGVILIAGMYIATLVLALMGSRNTVSLFLLSILCTIMVPLIIHLFMMLRNVRRGKNVMDEPYPYKEKRDDPDNKNEPE
ncbi:MAG: hypothetical protein J5829_06575 [Lachnospiraceae bacterium]|nr:hypothetical protein [Lachnospiraceae bacterium]